MRGVVNAMKFHEFGRENEKTLLLLHGVNTTWKMSFQKLIDIAKSRYHIIAVAEDGFNPDEPDVDATSIIDEASQITEYLAKNLDGKVDIILGESLGVMIMTEILLDPRIKVHTAIGDGYTILEYPNFKFDFMKRMMSGTIAGIENFFFKKVSKKWLAKLVGLKSADELDKTLYTGMSKATLYNLEYSMMPYRYKHEAFNLSDSYLWHGEKEPGLKQVRKKVDRSKYHFKHKVFLDRGHGSLLTEPERLLQEIELAYIGYDEDYTVK